MIVTSSYNYSSSSSSVAALSDGGFVVTWYGYGGGDISGIYAQRYDADSNPIGVVTLNAVPIINSTPIESVDEGEFYYYQFNVTDVDVNDYMSFSINGNPDWLTFNIDTGVLSGLPRYAADIGEFDITLTAGDGTSEVTQSFTLTVNNINDTPIVISPINDISTDEDNTFSFDVSSHFSDDDTNDVSTYSATLSDGTQLPAWLEFNSSTGVFNGTPTNDDVATINITITATDGMGTSVADTFVLTVDNVNDAAVITTADGAIIAGELSIYGTSTHTDIDNDDNVFSVLTDVPSAYGTYSVDVSGNWTYTLNSESPDIVALTSTSVTLNW